MEEVLTFDKSLQQRLTEFQDVLSGADFIPFSSIKREWTYYLEFTLDPKGWQAVWKIPRTKCEEFKIPFPTVVLAVIVDVQYHDLTALVKVVGVQDDAISIPKKHYVPLWQLWPMRDQDKSIGIDIYSTADALDKLRFFYIHILMPWDRDESDNIDWKSAHLENRLRLYYDLKNGVIPKPLAEHVYSLLNESRRLHSKREQLEELLGEDTDSELNDDGNVNKGFEELLEINVRILEIRNEIELFENPLYRKVIVKKQNISQKSKIDKRQIWLVFNTAPVDSQISYLEKVKELYPDQHVSFSNDLATQLEITNTNDVLILNESQHCIGNSHVFLENWTIQGIGKRDKTEILSTTEGVLLDFILENAVLENLTIRASLAQCAVLVRKGKGVLKNCKIVGSNNSTTHQGIIVLDGAELELVDCEITEFSTAIVGNSGSKIVIKNCKIHDSHYGCKIYDKCSLNMESVKIYDCKNYGMVVETDKDSERSGKAQKFESGFEILKYAPDVKIASVCGSNNVMGDIVLNQKPKIKAIGDLFADPKLDPTIIEDSSDEEMETDNLNNTVLENTANNAISV